MSETITPQPDTSEHDKLDILPIDQAGSEAVEPKEPWITIPDKDNKNPIPGVTQWGRRYTEQGSDVHAHIPEYKKVKVKDEDGTTHTEIVEISHEKDSHAKGNLQRWWDKDHTGSSDLTEIARNGAYRSAWERIGLSGKQATELSAGVLAVTALLSLLGGKTKGETIHHVDTHPTTKIVETSTETRTSLSDNLTYDAETGIIANNPRAEYGETADIQSEIERLQADIEQKKADLIAQYEAQGYEDVQASSSTKWKLESNASDEYGSVDTLGVANPENTTLTDARVGAPLTELAQVTGEAEADMEVEGIENILSATEIAMLDQLAGQSGYSDIYTALNAYEAGNLPADSDLGEALDQLLVQKRGVNISAETIYSVSYDRIDTESHKETVEETVTTEWDETTPGERRFHPFTFFIPPLYVRRKTKKDTPDTPDDPITPPLVGDEPQPRPPMPPAITPDRFSYVPKKERYAQSAQRPVENYGMSKYKGQTINKGHGVHGGTFGSRRTSHTGKNFHK